MGLFQSATAVVFLTGVCLCINLSGAVLYSTGWIREKVVFGRKLRDSGGILDFVFTAECVVNAISDLFLLAIVAYCLTCTLKGFIVWNTLSTVICWTASCMLHYERDQHFSGFHPYLALANETEFIQNSTVVAFVNQNFVPPLAFLYIATTLLAALKLVLLYGVYFGYLQAVCRGQLFNDPFQAYAREQDAAPLPSDFPATGRSIDSLVPQQPGYPEPGYPEPGYRRPSYTEPSYPKPSYHEPGYPQGNQGPFSTTSFDSRQPPVGPPITGPGSVSTAPLSPTPMYPPTYEPAGPIPGPPAHAPGGTLPPPLAGGPWPPSHSPMVPPVGSVPPYGGPSPPPPMGPAVLPYPAQAMPPPPPPAPPSLPVVNVEGGVGMPPSQGQRRVSLKPDVSVLTYSSADSVATTAHGTGHPPPESPLGGITLGGVVNQFLDSFTSTENVGRQQPPSTHETSQGEQRKKRKRRHQHQLDFATGPDAGIGGESSTP